MKTTSKTLRARKGFTLLELVTVLIVLAILAAIAVPTYARIKTNSRQQIVNATLIQVDRNAVAAAFGNGALASAVSNIPYTVPSTAGVQPIVTFEEQVGLSLDPKAWKFVQLSPTTYKLTQVSTGVSSCLVTATRLGSTGTLSTAACSGEIDDQGDE